MYSLTIFPNGIIRIDLDEQDYDGCLLSLEAWNKVYINAEFFITEMEPHVSLFEICDMNDDGYNES